MDIALAVHVGVMKISLYADETVLTNLSRSPIHVLFVKNCSAHKFLAWLPVQRKFVMPNFF